MADWIQRYSAALDARDTREQAHKPYIDACTRSHLVSKVLHMANTMTVDTALADRTAQLSRQQLQPASKPASPSPQSSQIPTSKERTGTPTKGNKDAEPTAAASDLLSTLRADLSATQKARATLQAQLSDLTTQLSALSTQQKVSQSQIAALSRQVLEAERKLQDRDEELRGKSKMVEQAQDEMVALELQFNLAEQRSEKLERENKELVERWMKRMGEEAEKVNRDSRWE
jgi:chromosome segregation ATPase